MCIFCKIKHALNTFYDKWLTIPSKTNKTIKINVKQMGVGNRTYHLVVRRGASSEA